ncbi:MAG TPA: hypothetical protein VFP40_01535 [Terriglobales bacterium]|nr:hypothetical protein [Terriglobales bacterium]
MLQGRTIEDLTNLVEKAETRATVIAMRGPETIAAAATVVLAPLTDDDQYLLGAA